MATKLLRRNSNQKMWVAIVRTATQNCLECALEAGLEENKVTGHKTVSGLRCSKLMSLGFVGVFLGVVVNLAGHARMAVRTLQRAGAMKPKSRRTISFPEDRQTPRAWLTLTFTLMICYATIVAFGLLRAVHL